ncbi:MFS transporter [Ideonella sp. DXS22W]|uniref:MFS transporter n=1 Tax=Pseudaquabacterium inlustre TaxID=2984192 RepID=A0ABU9CHC9_9BURK
MHARPTILLLNVAHAVDHMFLLIFATAVGSIAAEFGFARWEDLMPYGVGAFAMFGLGSLPAGRLGDLWGRRAMMGVFFFGMGVSALLAALAQGPWQLAAALTLIGAFASIYHPVGIPMLLQGAARPGATIGVNGLAGNLGIAVAAAVTGALMQALGWRAAFAVPGVLCLLLGALFLRVVPPEAEAPARRKGGAGVAYSRAQVLRALAVMTVASATGGILFNLTTNGNAQLLAERFHGLMTDPARLGAVLASVYAMASLAQVVVGRLIDRVALKPLYLGVVLMQVPALLLLSRAEGWWAYAAMLAMMVFIFGAIPFTDAMIARYVDDAMRSRVAGLRLAVSLGISSLAVWLLGPLVKGLGFSALLQLLAGVALCTAFTVLWLPAEAAGRQRPAA